jgi:hypothetical protein
MRTNGREGYLRSSLGVDSRDNVRYYVSILAGSHIKVSAVDSLPMQAREGSGLAVHPEPGILDL